MASNYVVSDAPDAEFLTGATVLDRVKLQLNFKPYYSDEGYKIFIYENALDPDATYNKDTDQKNMLKVVYEILDSLANDISLFRKIETEFVTQGEAANALQSRLKFLRSEIDRVKAEMHYEDSDFTFMYYTR